MSSFCRLGRSCGLYTIQHSTARGDFGVTKGAKISAIVSSRRLFGKICVFSGYLNLSAKLEANDVVCTLSAVTVTDANVRFSFSKNDGGGTQFFAKLNGSNQIVVDGGYENTASGQYYIFNFAFIAD